MEHLGIALVALAYAVYLFVVAIVGRRKFGMRLRACKDTESRAAFYRRWALRNFLRYGVPALVGIILLGKLGTLWNSGHLLSNPIGLTGVADRSTRLFFFLLAPYWIIVRVIQGQRSLKGVSRGKPKALAALNRYSKRYPPDSSVGLMIPRNDTERRASLWLTLSAAISEELFFRILIPAALVIVLRYFFGNRLSSLDTATMAFLLSIAVFGLMHAYQSWRGILGTMFLGATFFSIYYFSGLIIASVIVHITQDFSALYVRSKIFERAESYRIT